MYKAIKENFKGINQRKLAKKVNISFETLNRIINNKQMTTFSTAFCIVKSIDESKKIEDFFIKN